MLTGWWLSSVPTHRRQPHKHIPRVKSCCGASAVQKPMGQNPLAAGLGRRLSYQFVSNANVTDTALGSPVILHVSRLTLEGQRSESAKYRCRSWVRIVGI